jgi:hypothetical protein
MALSNEIIYYDNVPALDLDTVRSRFADWQAGKTVTSHAVIVGRVIPTKEDLAFTGSTDMLLRRFNTISDSDDPLLHDPNVHSLCDGFTSIIKTVKERSGITEEGSTVIAAGNYRERPERLLPHSDGKRMLRWLMSLGISGIFFDGEVCIEQCKSGWETLEGLIRDGVLVSQPQVPFGSVARIMSGDIHAGPDKLGSRLLFQHTVLLDA